MKLVVFPPSIIQSSVLSALANTIDGLHVLEFDKPLSEVREFVNDHSPSCFVFSDQISTFPEFEVLDSVLSESGVGTVIVRECQVAAVPNIKFQAHSKRITHIGAISADSIMSAVNHAIRLRCRDSLTAPLTQFRSDLSKFAKNRILMIGSSTGGVDALLKILSEFPEDCPPTLVVQHTGGQYAQSLIRLLDDRTPAQVVPAQHASRLTHGHIYLAPDDKHHLTIDPHDTGRVALSNHMAVSGHRPSVDALFESAVKRAPDVSAAILTGMGKDGARGICTLRRHGARTFGQDEKTCVVYGMPRVAMEQGGIETQLPIEKIGAALLESAREKAYQ